MEAADHWDLGLGLLGRLLSGGLGICRFLGALRLRSLILCRLLLVCACLCCLIVGFLLAYFVALPLFGKDRLFLKVW